jgi:hypothetical protein
MMPLDILQVAKVSFSVLGLMGGNEPKACVQVEAAVCEVVACASIR